MIMIAMRESLRFINFESINSLWKNLETCALALRRKRRHNRVRPIALLQCVIRISLIDVKSSLHTKIILKFCFLRVGKMDLKF